MSPIITNYYCLFHAFILNIQSFAYFFTHVIVCNGWQYLIIVLTVLLRIDI